jgi:AcrR family transcriptional regulator
MSLIAERRQEERERRRLEIVQAAELVCAEQGWDALTVGRVAKKARLSRALVYVYFQDRDDLHLAIVERALVQLRARMQAAADAEHRGIDKIRAIANAYLEFARDAPHAFDACSRFHARRSNDGPANARLCADAAASLLRVIGASIRTGVADGSLRSDLGAPALSALALWGSLHGVLQLATNKSEEISRTGIAIPQLLEHSFDMLRRGCRS